MYSVSVEQLEALARDAELMRNAPDGKLIGVDSAEAVQSFVNALPHLEACFVTDSTPKEQQ